MYLNGAQDFPLVRKLGAYVTFLPAMVFPFVTEVTGYVIVSIQFKP